MRFTRILSTLLCVVLLSIHSPLYATVCQIIEYPDRTEVICIGDPRNAAKNQTNVREYRQTSQAVYQPVREIPPGTTVNSCKMLLANHYDVTRNSNVEVEISCGIVGRGSEYIEFLLYGLNGTGERLLTTLISGYVGDDGTADFKKTFMAEFGKFINVRRWEPDITGNKITMSQTYLFNEKETLSRVTQIKQEVEKQEQMSVSSYMDSTSDIKLFASMGSVIFKHSTHLAESCNACHQAESKPGKIAGIGKDWSHKNCKGCHTEKKAGPTACKGCHKK